MRSLLFAPGNHARRVEKALGLAADGVILDLEDAVAISEKAATRAVVRAAFDKPRTGKLYVRVNGLGDGMVLRRHHRRRAGGPGWDRSAESRART